MITRENERCRAARMAGGLARALRYTAWPLARAASGKEGPRPMYMLSDLLRLPISDGQGRRTRLLDLAVDLGRPDYPAVTHLLVPGEGGSVRALPCPAELDPARGFVVDALDGGHVLDE